MKRIICLITVLCLIFGSFSFCFAQDWSATDSNNLANIRASVMSGGQLYNLVNACSTVLNNLNYNLVTLMGWLDPSTNGSQTAILQKILGALTYSIDASNLGSWIVELYNNSSGLLLLDRSTALEDYPNGVVFAYATSDGQFHTFTWNPTSNWRNNLFSLIFNMNNSLLYQNTALQNALTNGYNYQQTYTNWITNQSATFTPGSSTNGLYSWLSYIQSPVARLSYVLASDERIEAQAAAAANEEAVVNNFIDSSGAGSASPSDIGSVSDLSSGFSSNISTDADPSDIFDIFDSNNFSWFSQEVADSLDTTNSNNRSKSGSVFDTPLLDQRINDIYDALGVKHD